LGRKSLSGHLVFILRKNINYILGILKKASRKKSTMQPFYVLRTFRKKIIKWLPNAFTTRNHNLSKG
jgi:hypothetical protein